MEEVIEASLSDTSVREMTDELDREFRSLRQFIRECIEAKNVAVSEVIEVMKLLSPDTNNGHKMFQERFVTVIGTAIDHSELFGAMNFHWNYLDPSLLDHVAEKLGLDAVKERMDAYKSKLQMFKKETPISLFCWIQRGRGIKLSPEFEEISIEFDWPEKEKMEKIEKFQQEYASHYNLHGFAMTLAQVGCGCFIITWFIPVSIVNKFKANVPRDILKKYSATKVEIAGTCVYRKPQKGSTTASPFATDNLRPSILERMLMDAVSEGNCEKVEFLLSKGAPPNPASEFESTALMRACKNGNTEIACLLMDKGADPNIKNHQGWTALMAAANNNRYGTVDILLVRGANPDLGNDRGWTALMAAVDNGFKDVALRIIKAGATPHIQHKNGTNALLLAIPTNEKEVIDCLLEHVDHSQLDLKDEVGDTALMIACKNRNKGLVRQLLSMNANHNIHNYCGETPITIARQLGQDDVEWELINNSAN